MNFNDAIDIIEKEVFNFANVIKRGQGWIAQNEVVEQFARYVEIDENEIKYIEELIVEGLRMNCVDVR